MSGFGQFSAIYDSFGAQLDILMIWLFAAGLALGAGWHILPAMIPERKIKFVEAAYITAILAVMLFLTALAWWAK